MYTVTKNTKLISLVLMLTGVFALGYGFIKGAGHHTDEEITLQVTTFAGAIAQEVTDGVSESAASNYASLFHKIEDEFHLHFSEKEIYEAQDVNDVVHATIHALHAKSQRPWSSLLVAAIFFLGVSLLSVFFLALQYVAEVGWSVVLKRVLMAVGTFLPYVAVVIFIIILTAGFHLFGNHTYHWMAEGIMNPESANYDAIIAGKEGYLNFGFFFVRALI
jgi:hypothetical protein